VYKVCVIKTYTLYLPISIKKQIEIMKTLENITNEMRTLEVEIARQQAYISKHGGLNNAGEYDEQWEQYKEDAQYNLNKWDSMKKMRDEFKNKLK
jgi:uncharacterized secreted protein with C-terminal beta-propeller domain